MFSIPRIRHLFPAVLAAVAALALAVPAIASAAEHSLTINIEPEGAGTVECEVNEGPVEPCEEEYEEGTEVNLVPEAEEGFEFEQFGGDCGPLACELVMDTDHEVDAFFEGEAGVFYELGLEVEGEGEAWGEIECDAGFGFEECEAEYEAGTELTLLAVPDFESEFVEWGGDCASFGEAEECELTMDEEHFVSALFEAISPEFELEIAFGGTGSGEVECEAEEGPEACEAEYADGTLLTLIPVAEPGSEFAEWGGDCEGATCELVMDEEHFVEAIFNEEVTTHSLTINVTGEGEVECEVESVEEPCEAEYEDGTEITLVPNPETGWEFEGFENGSGSAAGCTGTSPCTFTIEADSEVDATFAEEPPTMWALGVNITGEGEVECEVNSGPIEICDPEYEDGAEITLWPEAFPESEFAGFENGSGSAAGCTGTSPCTFTIEADSEVDAVFVPEPISYMLEVGKAGTGEGTITSSPPGISCGGTCTAEFEEGEEVTLTAAASAGSEFVEWEGDCAGEGEECELTMDEAHGATAVFNAEPPPPPTEYTLTVNTAGTGSGSVSCDGGACAPKYAEGTSVTLAASPASGSTFAGWSGGGCSGTGSCVVTLNADTTVTATFNAESPPPPVEEGTARVASKKVTVKSGKALLKLRCSGGACKGKLKLVAKVKKGKKKKKLVIGKASFSIASGAVKTIRVKLNGPAKQELAKGKTVKAKVKGSGVVSATVKLKNAKKKGHHRRA